ncbi:hypothetical protein NQZ68_017182 [Dissostichus eleginoides]|nr:hypothetical protein NQZ68_017182 [Dissostichus eleginoides]
MLYIQRFREETLPLSRSRVDVGGSVSTLRSSLPRLQSPLQPLPMDHQISPPQNQFSVTLRLSLRARRSRRHSLIRAEHTHKECVGRSEMGSERRDGSATSSQRKGERSLVDGDEFQRCRGGGEELALCEVCYVAVRLLKNGRCC